MTKVQILGPKKYFQDIMSLLHSMGTLHINDLSHQFSPGDMFLRKMAVDPRSLKRQQDFQELLVKVKGILSVFEMPEGDAVGERQQAYDSLVKQDWVALARTTKDLISKVEEKARKLAIEKDRLENELSSLKTYENSVKKIRPLAERLVSLEGFETIALLVERKHRAVVEIIDDELKKITKGQYEVISEDLDEKTTSALLVYNKTYSEPVRRFVYDENVSELRLPPEIADRPLEEALEFLHKRIDEIPGDLEKVTNDLNDLSKVWWARFSAVSRMLQDQLEEIKSISQFGETALTFLVSGWMPKRSLSNAQKVMRERFDGKVMLSEVEVDHDEWEEAPVVYDNPSFVKPFEFLMSLLSPPRYGTVDPTPLMAVFFPIFFGFMVGDVGYGIIFLILAFVLRAKFKQVAFVQSASAILVMGSITTIFFGVIFGEVFGDWPHRLHLVREFSFLGIHLPAPRDDPEILPILFILAVTIGVGHVFLGLILGMVNSVREKSNKHLLEKLGMLIALFSVAIILVSAAQVLPASFAGPGYAALVIGVVLLIYGAGSIGILEVISGVGNIISYLRLAALGLASAMMALVANELGSMTGSVVLGFFIAGLLHLLNLALAAFSPSIQSLRLHFVEFFGKFLVTGGKPYNPFKRVGGM